MAQPARIVSLLALACIVYTSMLCPMTRARTMPSGVHGQEPLDDAGATSRSHFEDFVRALTAARTNGDMIVLPPDDDMPNDVFPLDAEHQRHRQQQHDADAGAEDKQLAALQQHGKVVMPPVVQFQKRSSGGRFCGPVLADVLELVCGTRFASLFGNKKRSTMPTAAAAAATENKAIESAESWPFVTGNKALQVLSNQHSFHRYTRGVHDECCLKACSISELEYYCSTPNKKY